MASADCALITLRDDMLGVMSPSKLHSNLAAGLPILYVGPRRSNVDDAIQRYECGASLPEGDVAGIVSFVRRSMESPDGLRALKHRARLAFEQAYCDRVNLQRFDEVIATLDTRGEFAAGMDKRPLPVIRRAA